MLALSRTDQSWHAMPAIALSLLACGVDAPIAMTATEPAPALAQRVYVGAAPTGAVPTAPDGGGAEPTPLHRYRFEGRGTVVRDSIGNADGSVVDTALAGDGFLRLPGGDAYVELPGGLLAQHQSATLELWLAWQGDASSGYEHIFDFGSIPSEAADAHEGGNFFLSPSYEDAKPRLQFRDQTGYESQVFSWRVFPSRRTTHVVVTLDGADHSMSLYVDGESLGSSPWNQTLAELNDENVWLGRSQEPGDPNLSATFDEFRIYDRALSSEQVARHFRDGPDGMPSDERP